MESDKTLRPLAEKNYYLSFLHVNQTLFGVKYFPMG